VYGVLEAAWPLIREDLGLSYADLGLIFAAEAIAGAIVEPLLGFIGDSGHRRTVITVSGIVFIVAIVLTGFAWALLPLLIALALAAPAAGGFVELSQATLMDLEPAVRAVNMARWTTVGWIGVLVGPLAVSAAIFVGVGWRPLVVGIAVAAIPLPLFARRVPDGRARRPVRGVIAEGFRAMRNRRALRWLVIVEFADLAGDVLFGFLALYFVDVVGLSPLSAGIAVAAWSGSGLIGEFMLVRALRWIDPIRYLKLTAAGMSIAVPGFLPVDGPLKFVMLVVIGLGHAGWYSIPKAAIYDELGESSGTVMALGAISGTIAAVFPFTIGLLANTFGLDAALWATVIGPLSLVLLIPSGRAERQRLKKVSEELDHL
jgi:MFS transporter, FSR family, fosmidomycin resistance protein